MSWWGSGREGDHSAAADNRGGKAGAAGEAERHRRLREQKAQAAGHESWAAAIDATRQLPAPQAAKQLGVGVTSITRWRAATSDTRKGDADD